MSGLSSADGWGSQCTSDDENSIANGLLSWHAFTMRIHLQNPGNDPLFDFSRAMWEAAAARAPDIGVGHDVSIGVTPADFVASMRDAEALVADASVIKALFPCEAPHLRLIFLTNAGLNQLAPFDWLPPDVVLLNNRGTHAAKAGEFAIMSILMLANRIPAMATNQRHHKWRKLWGSVLGGRNVTVVGLGTLGGATAEQAARFGMRVTGVRAHPAPHPACEQVIGADAIEEALPSAEFLILACPLTAATRGLMNRQRLECLPSGAGLVNIGRGQLLDQDALCDLLEQEHLSGAVLDVFTPEPIPPGHRLWSTRNLIISPHTSADDPATYNPHSLDIFLDNLRALRDRRPLPNRYDITRGY
jgi:glyoxylate/hydroxypyruvate reductase A